MGNASAPMREEVIGFGPFKLFIDQRVLRDENGPVRLGGRAMDLLIALVERAGETVGKNELIHRAWATSIVEENTLRVHIAAIRKLLGEASRGDRYIVNVAGRGYSFVAPVVRLELGRSTAQDSAPANSSLPRLATRVLGRDDVIKGVVALLGRHRLITLVGPGGIGKTTVAIAVADRLANEQQRVVRFVDMSIVTDPVAAPMVLAMAAGLGTPTDDPIGALIRFLQGAPTLLVLDNCEHLVADIAQMAERILRGGNDVAILCTSRERLSADGEYPYALGPLQCPAPDTPLNCASALNYSAIQLFVERALDVQESFEVSDRNVGAIVEICRRLDCTPLALELVAARLGSLGIDLIATSLARNPLLVSKGRRSGNERHQSLVATLNWSYELLPPEDQITLRRLAVFQGSFTAESAGAICESSELTADEVVSSLMSLLSKSLLVADTNQSALRFRLLQLTRAFAHEKLQAQHEVEHFSRRHALHHLGLLARSADWDKVSGDEWSRQNRESLDDVRAALQWSFAPGGDLDLGASLFVAALPFGFQLSTHDFQARAMTALRVLASKSPPDRLSELRVHTAMHILMFQDGSSEYSVAAEIARMVELSDRLEEPRHRVEAYAARAIFALEQVDYTAAVQGFEALQGLARRMDDPLALLVADRVGAQVFDWVGDQPAARIRAERVLRHPTAVVPLTYRQAQVDRRVSMRVVLARGAWLEGRSDEARAIAQEAVELASLDVPISLCHALGFAACPIALWRGDTDEASQLIASLLDRSRRYDFRRWYRLALCFTRSLGQPVSLPSGEATPIGSLQRQMLATIDAKWADSTSLWRAEAGLAGWCNAELQRLAAERMERDGAATPDAIHARFRTALEFARKQGALAWELRVAISLARSLAATREAGSARDLLQQTYDRFSEGLTTRDLVSARVLLEET